MTNKRNSHNALVSSSQAYLCQIDFRLLLSNFWQSRIIWIKTKNEWLLRPLSHCSAEKNSKKMYVCYWCFSWLFDSQHAPVKHVAQRAHQKCNPRYAFHAFSIDINRCIFIALFKPQHTKLHWILSALVWKVPQNLKGNHFIAFFPVLLAR